jgi:hypothetical protein
MIWEKQGRGRRDLKRKGERESEHRRKNQGKRGYLKRGIAGKKRGGG